MLPIAPFTPLLSVQEIVTAPQAETDSPALEFGGTNSVTAENPSSQTTSAGGTVVNAIGAITQLFTSPPAPVAQTPNAGILLGAAAAAAVAAFLAEIKKRKEEEKKGSWKQHNAYAKLYAAVTRSSRAKEAKAQAARNQRMENKMAQLDALDEAKWTASQIAIAKREEALKQKRLKSFMDREHADERQYDLTFWMPLVINRNIASPELEDMEYYDDQRRPKIYDLIAPGILMPRRSIFSGLWLTELAGDFRTLNTGGGRWDIKLEMKEEFVNGPDDEDAAHILCSNSGTCRWVDYSTAGNILYGVTAADAGVPRWMSKLAGGGLEIWEGTAKGKNWRNWFEDPYDTKAVEFGYDLYESTGGNITEEAFREALTDEVLDSLQPSPEGFVPPFEAQPQPNAYPANRFDQPEKEE